MKKSFKERCERDKFRGFRSNLRYIQQLERDIEKLQKQRARLPVVKDKVDASMEEFPFIPTHVTVDAYDPIRSAAIERLIWLKQMSIRAYEEELFEVETYIENIEDPLTREVFHMVYIEGMTQKQVAKKIHYSLSHVSKLVSMEFKRKLKE